MKRTEQVLNSLYELQNKDLKQSEKLKLSFPNSEDIRSCLDNLNIEYEKLDSENQLQIDLDQEDFYIRKSAEHFLQTCHNQTDISASSFKKDIIIVDKKIIYSKDNLVEDNPLFFQNVLCSFELITLFKSCLVDFNDVTKQKFTFLSHKTGKIDISYEYQSRIEAIKFFESNSGFIKIVKNIKDKIENDRSFINFFKDAFIENATNCFFKSLEKIERICAIADRNFQLYKSKFDFNEFEKGLHEAKENYFNTYFKFQSEMLSKIGSLPIQFGIYIFLLTRFSEELLGTIATAVLLTGWGVFSISTIQNLKKDLKDIELDFLNSLKRIKAGSGLSDEDLADHKKLILDKSKSSIRRIAHFGVITYLFSAILLIFSFRQIYLLT